MITEFVAAVYDRRTRFFKAFGDHRSPVQREKASCHARSLGERVPRRAGAGEGVFVTSLPITIRPL